MSLKECFYVFIGILGFCSCSNKDKLTVPPNIILINVDDLGWRDLGFMGSEYYKTPNIDNLVKQGMIFTNGYAAAANCAPSRACLMTGKWTPRHEIYTVGRADRGLSKHRKLIPIKNATTLSKSHNILPQILREHGYTTCHSGKWHLSKDPLEFGFQVNIGGGHNGSPANYYPPYNNIKFANQVKTDDHLTNVIMKQTVNFLDTVRQSFFLYYAPYAVHTPIQPIDSLVFKYKNKSPWNGQNNPNYATMVENLDRNIGLMISKLMATGHYDNTLIIFTSDNGGVYGITKQRPLRAGKGSYYEGGIREPFAFVWKGNILDRTNTNTPITNLDVFPTLLSAAGIELQKYNYDGANLMPLLSGQNQVIDRPLFWHFPIYLQSYNSHDNENRDSLFRTRPGSAVRYGHWKLHYYFEDDEVELYDLSKDIGERHNLAKNHPDKVLELLKYLQTWWRETGAPIPEELNPEYEPI